MPDGLYEHDALAWAEQQAALLRRLAAGEGGNDAVDWVNVIKEVQDVGLSELRACESLLQQAMVHLLRQFARPDNWSVSQSEEAAGACLDHAVLRFAPSMHRRINLDELYARARRRVVSARDQSGDLRYLPLHCPFTIIGLLEGDTANLLGRIETAGGHA